MGKGDGSDLKVKILSKKELIFHCACSKQENCTVSFCRTQKNTSPPHLLSGCLTHYLLVRKVFPDVGNNAAVISLQDGPVVEGDVKVTFESSAVSLSPPYVPESGRSSSLSSSYTSLFRVCPKAMKMFPSTSGSTPPLLRTTRGF